MSFELFTTKLGSAIFVFKTDQLYQISTKLCIVHSAVKYFFKANFNRNNYENRTALVLPTH